MKVRTTKWRDEQANVEDEGEGETGDKEVDWKGIPCSTVKINLSKYGQALSRRPLPTESAPFTSIDPKKSYEIGFRVSLSEKWDSSSPIFIMARRGATGHFVARKVSFEGRSLHEEFDIPDKFCVKFSPQDSSNSESYLYIGMYDHWNSNWKRGLNIHHAFARELNRN
ncbi:hypothetical protein LguiA_005228 [Lonicera macranthoides]